MTTLTKLNVSKDTYEFMILDLYYRWCESVTLNNRHFQIVLANSKINSWFLYELKKCENEFKEITDRYILSSTVSSNDYLKCWKNTTYRLFNIRPMPLLEEIKIPQKHLDQVPLTFISINQN